MTENPYASDILRHLERISLRKRKSPVVLFFGRDGAFSDNSKYLYLDAIAGDYGFDPLWVTADTAIASLLTTQSLPALLLDSPPKEALRILLKAAVAVFCINPNDVFADPHIRASVEGAFRLQLWHGVFAGPQDLQVTDIAPLLNPRLTYQLYGASSIDTILSPAASYDDRFAEAFGTTEVLRDGYPRNAVLFREPTEQDCLGAFRIPEQLKASGGRNILYCPSHTRVGTPVWRESWLLDKFREAHEASGDTIFIKPHPFEAAIAPVSRTLSPGLHLIAALDDIYPALRDFDLLISDYSSLMDDFHLTGKPMLVLQTPQTEKVRQHLLLPDLHYRNLAPVVTADDLPVAIEAALGNRASKPVSSIYTEDHHGSAARLNHYIAGQVQQRCTSRYRLTDLNGQKSDSGGRPS
tara:strand:+ start:7201 stop:8430 length:1230 start_codon:yes stop_codon:yes gene_type:complete